jgi:hypothetical protein
VNTDVSLGIVLEYIAIRMHSWFTIEFETKPWRKRSSAPALWFEVAS